MQCCHKAYKSARIDLACIRSISAWFIIDTKRIDGVKMMAEFLTHHSHNQNQLDIFGNLRAGECQNGMGLRQILSSIITALNGAMNW